jgi:hypothetical protein
LGTEALFTEELQERGHVPIGAAKGREGLEYVVPPKRAIAALPGQRILPGARGDKHQPRSLFKLSIGLKLVRVRVAIPLVLYYDEEPLARFVLPTNCDVRIHGRRVRDSGAKCRLRLNVRKAA